VASVSLMLICGAVGCTRSTTSSVTSSTVSSVLTAADTAKCWRFWGSLGPDQPSKQQLEAAARLIAGAHDSALQTEGRAMLTSLTENTEDYYPLEDEILSTCKVKVPPPT